eukprot:TRINITY_DN49778_c0_g1_i1.p1 TRINITY_DN49778_c0_g1~~TRINITY_DN49778_c0_g1_i1.p1  ORF type:complete len:175 (+),score=21.11 TRINITY_DN49778_c0_g1_i1:155-679(+)
MPMPSRVATPLPPADEAVRHARAPWFQEHSGLLPEDVRDDAILWEACRKGDVAATQTALRRGARPSVAGANGLTSLHMAATHVNIPVAVQLSQLLLEARASVNARDATSSTPLHHCAANPGTGVWSARVLLAYSAEVMLRNEAGQKPIDMLSDCEDTLAFRTLLLSREAISNAG